MAWEGSGYQQPPDWKRTVRRILRRDRGICHVCHKPGADSVDHITPVNEGGQHADDNYGAIHSKPCHQKKTAAEAARARKRKRVPRMRPKPKHPGLLP